MSGEFETKDLGAAKKILRMKIHRDRVTGRLYLSQKKYVEKVLEQFGMKDCKIVSTPLAVHFRLFADDSPKTEKEMELMFKVLYASAISSIKYAMVCTRPDISHVVSVVSSYMKNPEKVHWAVVKWILHYFRGTSDVSVVF